MTAIYIKNLKQYNREDVVSLMTHYFVRTDNVEDHSSLNTILKWLKPKPPKEVKNYYNAILKGIPFKLHDDSIKELCNKIFGYDNEGVRIMIKDFSLYPVIKVFEREPINLLKSYITLDDKKQFFEEITEIKHNRFLNDIERIFYLTRGYGRPNEYISKNDRNERNRYMKANNTALLALCDYLDLESKNYNPEIIREILSVTNLVNIPDMYKSIVTKITDVFVSEITIFNKEKFQEFLTKIGMSTYIDYDPIHDVFRSNITQLGMYYTVVPTKKFLFDEIADKSKEKIRELVDKLSDKELLNAETPSHISIQSIKNIITIKDHLRENIIKAFMDFVFIKQYIVCTIKEKECIIYGRLSSSKLKKIYSEKFINNIKKHEFLVDPESELISLESARSLYQKLQNKIINKYIKETCRVPALNEERIKNLSDDSKRLLKKKFQSIPENYTIADIKLILNSVKRSGKLHLIASGVDYKFLPVTIIEYINRESKISKEILSNTLDYYIEVL